MARRLAPGERAGARQPQQRQAGRDRRPAASASGVEVVSAGDLGLPEPEEDAPDFVGNARIKALAAARRAGCRRWPTIRGSASPRWAARPGVQSARWAGPAKDFAAAMARVNRRWATPTTAAPGSSRRCASAGRTAIPRRSSAGWTAPRFGPRAGRAGSATTRCSCRPARPQTFGEMAPDEKHAVSHRARAFAQLLAACLT